jgi:hypothetical protein
MSRGQHAQGNKHPKTGTRGSRADSKITRGVPNVFTIGGLPRVKVKRRHIKRGT